MFSTRQVFLARQRADVNPNFDAPTDIWGSIGIYNVLVDHPGMEWVDILWALLVGKCGQMLWRPGVFLT